MEMLYHVNEEDEVIGSISREDAHNNMWLHRSGIVFLMNSFGKTFVTYRGDKPTFDHCNDSSVSFHYTYDEESEFGARREMMEELSIDADLVYIGKFVHRDPPEYQVVHVYVCRTDEIPDVKEALYGEFHTHDEIDEIVRNNRITPWLRDGWRMIRNSI